jgi:hypothetical protein
MLVTPVGYAITLPSRLLLKKLVAQPYSILQSPESGLRVDAARLEVRPIVLGAPRPTVLRRATPKQVYDFAVFALARSHKPREQLSQLISYLAEADPFSGAM